MLILSRKEGESIVIGDNITVKIVSAEKGIVKIGIDAPRDVTILRSELVEAVESANKEASEKTADDNILKDLFAKLNK
ncbi:MAG: carbon storage regulator CsrA [Sulfurimonadaceae bacterium]|nr:carbon storage regulator CsrA [Sulfurimonadaceae bacterium]